MFHPSIITTYRFHRSQRQINPVDACTDTAHGYGINVHTLAELTRLREAIAAELVDDPAALHRLAELRTLKPRYGVRVV